MLKLSGWINVLCSGAPCSSSPPQGASRPSGLQETRRHYGVGDRIDWSATEELVLIEPTVVTGVIVPKGNRDFTVPMMLDMAPGEYKMYEEYMRQGAGDIGRQFMRLREGWAVMRDMGAMMGMLTEEERQGFKMMNIREESRLPTGQILVKQSRVPVKILGLAQRQ